MAHKDDIAYAAAVTRIVLAPQQTLETFGTTCIRYHLVSELMDAVNKVRVRRGKVFSERPQIVTPQHYAAMLDGFGENARKYAEWLRSHGKLMQVLRYGLQFRKDQAAQEIISDSIDAVAGRVKATVAASNEPLSAVIVGADEMWEVSLLKFVFDFIQHSAPTNVRELGERARAEEGRAERGLRQEIENGFRRAAEDATCIGALGRKLEKSGLFDEYEDRFYALLR